MALRVPILPALLITLGTLLPATAASADPVTIGSIRIGGLMMWGDAGFRVGDITVSIAGSGFRSPGYECFICGPGSTLSLGGSLSDLDGSVAFSTPSFRLPDVLPPVGSVWTVTL